MKAVYPVLPPCLAILTLMLAPQPAAARTAHAADRAVPPARALQGDSLVGMSCAEAIAALLAEGIPASAIVIANDQGVVLTPAQVALLGAGCVVKSVTGNRSDARSGSGRVTVVVGPPDKPDPHGDDPTVVELTAGTMLGLLAGMSLIAASVLLAGVWISRSIRDQRQYGSPGDASPGRAPGAGRGTG